MEHVQDHIIVMMAITMCVFGLFRPLVPQGSLDPTKLKYYQIKEYVFMMFPYSL